MSVTATDFDYIAGLVRDEVAIVLESTKSYLVESRLSPVLRRHGAASISDLVDRLRAGDRTLRGEVIEAMTTNETSWFRDVHPFTALEQHVLPDVVARRQQRRQLVIWCAAASSGQEPYSVAMLIKDKFPELSGWNVRIVATDISGEMLAKAMTGRYSQLEVNRGLPAALLARHFKRVGQEWEIKEEIRQMVEFRVLNLVAAWPTLPPIDVVLLRNVLIYFDLATKRQILARTRQAMRPDGYLFLGAPETTLNVDDAFERVTCGPTTCYRIRHEAGGGSTG